VAAQPVTIASVVEGEGEVRALPKLLFRLARELSVPELRAPPPMRVNRGRLLVPGGIERAVNAMAHRAGASGGVLVLIDADDDCPATLGPSLLSRARKARSDIPISVVLAMREFEGWYLASASSFAGQYGFPTGLSSPSHPEQIRGAKEWLSRQRVSGRPYKPTVDQALLVSAFDMEQARRHAPSFDKFCRDVESLFKLTSFAERHG
jgi:hypothetical protein